MPLQPSSAPSVNRGIDRAVERTVAADPSLAALAETPPDDLEASYNSWLAWLFPGGAPMGPHHRELWDWAWALEAGQPAAPFVGIWPRGGAKSTNVERLVAMLGARKRRTYVLYISETQAQADKHVQSIAGILEKPRVAAAYPLLAERAVGKYGSSKGWRGNRLRTASGLTVDAIGLDTALRGAKVDEDRPDLIILDDIDGKFDTPAATAKKIESLTTNLLPSQAPHAAVLAVQNLITPHGIFAQLADGRAEFLATRRVSGPHPALRGFALESYTDDAGRQRWRITAGTPIWGGQDRAVCQHFIDTWGPSAFKAECLHDVEPPPGGMFDHLVFRRVERAKVPPLVRIVVWCDPAVTDTDQSDANGIQVDGIARDGTIYRLWSWEQRATPLTTLKTALRKAAELNAAWVGVETNQGGDTWKSVYNEAWAALVREGSVSVATRRPPLRSATAGSGTGGKTERASKMLAGYERGNIVHVLGTHETLEAALRRFPRTKPFDLTDAAYWAWADLAQPPKQVKTYSGGAE